MSVGEGFEISSCARACVRQSEVKLEVPMAQTFPCLIKASEGVWA
jgi:hypothetical protein